MEHHKMTPEEFRQFLKDRDNVGLTPTPPKEKGKNKFQAKRVQIDGFWFDSVKEGQVYLTLKYMKIAGEIVDFERQPKYNLVVNGIKVSSYKGDFKVVFRDRVEIWDVKSYITAKQNDYIIRKKLMLALYGITIVEK